MAIKAFHIAIESDEAFTLRDWNTGESLKGYEGDFVSYGKGAPYIMRTWMENGERAFAAVAPYEAGTPLDASLSFSPTAAPAPLAGSHEDRKHRRRTMPMSTATVIPVRSLAEMRRAVAIPGVTIRVLAHWQERLRGTTRTPVRIQTNAYTFLAPDGQENWCYYPKTVKELRFNSDGSVTFFPDTQKSWTLLFEHP